MLIHMDKYSHEEYLSQPLQTYNSLKSLSRFSLGIQESLKLQTKILNAFSQHRLPIKIVPSKLIIQKELMNRNL